MKSILMAAVMTVSVLAGSAHAVQEGGCILPKPPKPKVPPSAQSRDGKPVRYCGDEPCRPKPIIQDPQAAAPAASGGEELPECDMLPRCKR